MLKSLCLSLAFIAISTSFAFSQEVVIKPTVGLNFTDFSKDPQVGKYKSKTGYQFGGSVSFGQKFYVEPGIFYARTSTNYTFADSSTGRKSNFDLTGIRIPVAIGYSIIGGEHPTDPFGLRIFGGGSAFILTKVNQGEISDYSKTQWGVFAGAGIDVGIVFLDAKYEWSLTNIQKDISMVDIGKTRSFFINLGVRIPVGN